MSVRYDPLGYYATRSVFGPPPGPVCSHQPPESCPSCDGSRQGRHERQMTYDAGYRLRHLMSLPEHLREAEAEFADHVYGDMPALRRQLAKRRAA